MIYVFMLELNPVNLPDLKKLFHIFVFNILRYAN